MSAKAPTVKSARTSPESTKKTTTKSATSSPLPSPGKTKAYPEKAAVLRSSSSNGKDSVKLPTIAPSTPIQKPEPPVKAPISKPVPTSSKRVTAVASPTKVDTKSKPSKASSMAAKPTAVPPLAASSSLPCASELSAPSDNDTPASSTPDAAAVCSAPDSDDALKSQNEVDAKAEAEALVEAERLRTERGNGTVKLIYEQYDEEFPIVDGSTTQSSLDEVYCLSFVMPECLVHLSRYPNAERFARENAGVFDSLVREEPRGVYQDLERGETYFVVVEQEADQLRRDQEATRVKWSPELERDKQLAKTEGDGRGFETCSCVYGNPCVDEYSCKDWFSRFAIATAHGWKGF